MKLIIFNRLRSLLIAATGAFAMSMSAQTTISGVVTDKTGEPLIGVTVLEKGASTGTTTNLDGDYNITVADATKAVLVFSYVGMTTQEVAVAGRTTIDVTMDDSAVALNEVVVVGYGTQKKSDLTGSVASIDESQLNQTIAANADQMLQGKIAGVSVTQNSGAPGGATSIRVRGASSLNSSNEPLYVIDGIPMTNTSSIGGFDWAGGSNGQTTVNPLASIAPSDIVSINVLKDASACAIYGAAGANGVVLVTTRRGNAGHTNVTYDGYVAWQTTAKRLDMMNLKQYGQYQQQLFNEGIIGESNFDKAYADVSLLGEGTDWQDEIFRTAFMQSHQVGVNGGNDRTTYSISAGYLDQEGIIIGSDFNRFNTRFNVDTHIVDWLKMGGSLAYTRTNETITRNDGSDGVIMQAVTMMPSVPVRDFDGNWAGPSTVNGSSLWNPVALALQTNNTMLRQRVTGNYYIDATFLKYFTLRSEFAFDAAQNKNKSYIPRYEFGAISNDINQMMQKEDHSWFWMQKDYLTYHQTFNRHDVTAMVGFEASKSTWEGTQFIKKNFLTDNIFVLGEDGEYVSNYGWKDGASSASFFGRANYGYDNRYLLTATLRADGSSKFGPNNKWGWFPSVAAAWRISQESFLQDVTEIANLKLRLGYGRVGNSNIDTYRYAAAMMTMLTPNGTAFFPNNLSNPDLKWESSQQYNAGIDFAMFNNRLDISVDVYRKETKDLLMQIYTPSYIATNEWQTILNPYANVGKTRNTGIDVSISARPVVTKDFTWQSNLVLSHNKNKVVSLNDDSQVLYGSIDWWSQFQTATMFKAGLPMGVFYGYETEGLFQNADDIRNHATQTGGSEPYANNIDQTTGVWVGDIKFKDQNGDGVIDENDQVVIGDPNPDLTFGWTNTFTWREWELGIGLTGQIGGDVLNFARFKTEGLTSIWDNQSTRVLGR